MFHRSISLYFAARKPPRLLYFHADLFTRFIYASDDLQFNAVST